MRWIGGAVVSADASKQEGHGCPGLGPFSADFACSSSERVGSLQVLGIPPAVQKQPSLWQLGQIPAEPSDPGHRNKLVWKINEW